MRHLQDKKNWRRDAEEKQRRIQFKQSNQIKEQKIKIKQIKTFGDSQEALAWRRLCWGVCTASQRSANAETQKRQMISDK